jgi:hypothetical protein
MNHLIIQLFAFLLAGAAKRRDRKFLKRAKGAAGIPSPIYWRGWREAPGEAGFLDTKQPHPSQT